MSYHLSGSLSGLGRISGYGGAGGLGSDAQKQNLTLAKAIQLNELTPGEVAKVKSTWDTYNANLRSLTTGKKKISIDKAVGIIGPFPTIESIVGHPLVPGAAGGAGAGGALPGLSPPPGGAPPGGGGSSTTDDSGGTPWGLIAGGAALLAVGYFATRG